MTSKIIDIDVVFGHKTERAIGVTGEEGGKDLIWLPLSQVEVSGNCHYGSVITLTGPEKLFLDKGLI